MEGDGTSSRNGRYADSRNGNAGNAGTNNAGVNGNGTNSKPRKCYLFCEQGNGSRLFEELDKKTAVPLIPEFRDYMLGELQSRGILKPLQVISRKEKFDVWLLTMTEGEKNIVSVVDDGLKSGSISIPGAVNSGLVVENGESDSVVGGCPDFGGDFPVTSNDYSVTSNDYSVISNGYPEMVCTYHQFIT